MGIGSSQRFCLPGEEDGSSQLHEGLDPATSAKDRVSSLTKDHSVDAAKHAAALSRTRDDRPEVLWIASFSKPVIKTAVQVVSRQSNYAAIGGLPRSL